MPRVLIAALIVVLSWVSYAQATPPATPITLELALDDLPRLNQSATVRITVRSTRDAPRTHVELLAPDGSTAMRQKWTVDLRANLPVTMSTTVVVQKAGNLTLSARAISARANGAVWGDMKSIAMSVSTRAASRHGWAVEEVPVAMSLTAGNARVASKAPTPFNFSKERLEVKAEPPSVMPARTAAADVRKPKAGRESSVTLTGTWLYADRNGANMPVDQTLIEIRKADGSALSPAAFCYTNADGAFSCPFTHPGTNMRVWVRSWTRYSSPGVDNRLGVFSGPETSGGCGSDSYVCSYPVQTSEVACASGNTCSVGTWVVNGVGEPWQGAHWMEQDLIRSWKKAFFATKHGAAVSSGPGRINYPVPSGHGTHAHVPPGDGWISIEPPNQQSAHIPTHEYGHVVMANLWAGFSPQWPPFDCPSPHYVTLASGPGCALFEGFADFWAWYSLDDPVFKWPGGASTNMETRDSGTYQAGDQVEGNIAAVLGDWYDGAADGPTTAGDHLAQGIQHIWHTISSQSGNNFAEFWADFSANPDHAPCAALDAVKYNSINYSLGQCQTMTINLSASPLAGGIVRGGGTFETGTMHTVRAVPRKGYRFVRWTQGSVTQSTNSSYKFKLRHNRNLVARFQKAGHADVSLNDNE